jgi:hypothetical protein
MAFSMAGTTWIVPQQSNKSFYHCCGECQDQGGFKYTYPCTRAAFFKTVTTFDLAEEAGAPK